jgi:hypothetical protein
MLLMATDAEVWEHMSLIDQIARQINLDSSLAADVGLDILRSAAKTHRPERGPFKPYAKVCLKTGLLNYKRKQGLCYQITDQEDSRQMEQIHQLDDAESALPIESIRDLVTEEEYELLYAWFVECTSRAALEARYGVLRTTLWVRVQKILKRVRKA